MGDHIPCKCCGHYPAVCEDTISELNEKLAAATARFDEEETNKLRAIGLYDSCKKDLDAANERAEKVKESLATLIELHHADTIEFWETLQIASGALDRIHDCVTGKPFASNDEVAYILNAAEIRVKKSLLKHCQSYSTEYRSAAGTQCRNEERKHD